MLIMRFMATHHMVHHHMTSTTCDVTYQIMFKAVAFWRVMRGGGISEIGISDLWEIFETLEINFEYDRDIVGGLGQIQFNLMSF